MAAVTDPRYMFTAVNEFLKAQHIEPMFEVQLVGLTSDVKLAGGVFTVHPDALIEDVPSTDLVLIPALSGDMAQALEANKKFIPWIVDQYQNGAEVASLCIGAFLLADTGLLKGKRCSTHWIFANDFRQLFPDVELVDGSIITEENGIYSSGGASSYWNLLLYLVEKYTNRETAVLASKFFAIDIERNTQSFFMIFKGQKDHEDEQIKKAQDFIENNYQEKIAVDQLADMCIIGRRSFERRFKKATNNTVAEYIQRVKVEAAKRSLENSRRNINEVMYDVGYTDTKAFRSVFKRITGLTPVEYRNKYNKQAIAVM